MRLWRWVLLLLLVAALTAWGWHWIAADPGQVLIRIRGWRLETSLLVLVVGLILLWALLGFLGRLVKWPFGAVPRRRQRLAQARLAAGVVGLYEGRNSLAERKLRKAARFAPLRAPAQLLQADAARRQGSWDQALESLDHATEQCPQAARVLRARILRERGEAGQAARLLGPEAEAGKLTPEGWHELVLARLATDDADGALTALVPLRKSAALGSEAMDQLDKRVLAAALTGLDDPDELAALWRRLSRAQHNDSALVALYARHALAGGAGLAAISAIKSVLGRHWSSELAVLYVNLEAEPAEKRLREGEKWLVEHPDDPALLTALGTLCARSGLAGKAQHYLQQAVALDPEQVAAWTALGDVSQAEGAADEANRHYRKALGLALHDGAHALLAEPQKAMPVVVEERNLHGVPRLPNHGFERGEDEGA